MNAWDTTKLLVYGDDTPWLPFKDTGDFAIVQFKGDPLTTTTPEFRTLLNVAVLAVGNGDSEVRDYLEFPLSKVVSLSRREVKRLLQLREKYPLEKWTFRMTRHSASVTLLGRTWQLGIEAHNTKVPGDVTLHDLAPLSHQFRGDLAGDY